MTFRGRAIVTEESIRQFWPDKSAVGFIRQVSIEDGTLILEWGAWTSQTTRTTIPLAELIGKIDSNLPSEVVAGNLPGDSISLVFRGSEQTDSLRARLKNGDVYEFGVLTSNGFERNE